MKLSDILLDGFREDDSNPIDVKFIIYQYLRFWWLFVTGLIVCVSLAFFYLFYSTPQYAISSSLLIKVDQNIDFTRNAVLSDLEGYEFSGNIENELEVLGSYSLMRDAIETLALDASYYIEDRFSRKKEIYGSQVPIDVEIHERREAVGDTPDDPYIKIFLFENGFAIENTSGNLQNFKYGDKVENWFGVFSLTKKETFFDVFEEPILMTFNNKDQLAAAFSGALRVELVNKMASVVDLKLTDPVPGRGVDILNSLIDAYNLQAVNDKNIIAKNTLEFIEGQLSALTKDLKEIERKVEDYKRINSISDLNTELSFYVQNTGEYEAQLSRNRTQVQVLESIENYLRNPSGISSEVTSSLTIEDQTLAGLVNKFNDLQSERQRMLRTSQPNNPLVLNLDAQLSSLRQNILTNLSNIKSGLEIENRNLQSRVDQLGSRASNVPEIERGLMELTREQGIKQEHYLYLVKKREESELSLAATTVSNSRIVDAPSASGSPVSPKRNLVLGFALMLGLGIPIGFIYVRDQVQGKIMQKKDVQKITSIPIIGEISHNDSNEKLVVAKKRRTPIAEQFRLLRTNLNFLEGNHGKKVILVTSSISGEGKTFFSLNLGASLSLGGKRTVIMEFDLRKPSLLNSIGLKNRKGISDYLMTEEESIDDLILDFDPIPNLSIIGCGTIPDDPAELMMSPKTDKLIKELEHKFDHIILDTAPIGTIADAFSLVSISDCSLFLVRYNYTRKDHIRFMEEINIKEKLKNPMIIMNDAKKGMGYYGYAYGYEDNKKIYS